MNIPNTLTLARIVLVPLVVWLIITHQMTAAFVLFLLAGVSDAADGYLAKRFQWRTELGAYLDPIADKLLLMSIYVTLGFLPATGALTIFSAGAYFFGWLAHMASYEPVPVPLPSRQGTSVQLKGSEQSRVRAS